MPTETFEQYEARRENARKREAAARWPEMVDENNPDHWIYKMPTVGEVVAAGYKAEYHASVAEERAEFVRRFREDPEFRATTIRHAREARAAEQQR
jgi:hypothetical protein